SCMTSLVILSIYCDERHANLRSFPTRRSSDLIPMSSATGFYILIMTIVQGLQYVFTPIRVVTQGGPNYLSSNLIYHSYQEAFDLFNTGVSAASSVITLVIFVVLLALQFLFVERNVHYEN